MNIIILNLSRKIREEALTKLFKEHGAVESCNIVMDKVTNKSKGFGFVEMPNEDEANAAIKALNGSEVDGSKIRVKISTKTK